MSSDVVANLQLDGKFGVSRVVVAKEINNCDSSFIISSVLGHCIRNKNAVLVITTHNSLSHYQNVGLKMTYNLQKHIDSGLIDFYNLGQDHLKILMSDENATLEDMFLKVKEKILSLKEDHDTVNVLFDGVSHLFDLRFTLTEVNTFCANIIQMVRIYDNSFVIFNCNIASEDDVTYVMANLLAHKAHTVAEVESLSSGWSTDVSGHLVIKHPGQKFQQEHMFTMDLKPSRYLFKLFDRGVKLFAPGTV